MLVRWSHDARGNHDTVGNIMFHALLHGHNGHDTGGACLKVNRSRSVKNPAEDVFVVGDGHDHLDDKLSSTGNFGTTVSEVGVFPTNPSIDFVHANGVLHLNWFTLLVVNPSIEIFDDTKTIAAEGKIVGSGTSTTFTEIVS